MHKSSMIFEIVYDILKVTFTHIVAIDISENAKYSHQLPNGRIYIYLTATNKTQETKNAPGLSVDNPRAKLLDLHNWGAEKFTSRIPMVSQFLGTW